MLQDKRYKISFLQQLLVLFPSIAIGGLPVIFVIYLYDGWSEMDLIVKIIVSLVLLLFLVPSIFLHIQYLVYNAASPVVVSWEKQIIEVGKAEAKRIYHTSELKEIIYCAAICCRPGAPSTFLFDSYRYYKLCFSDAPPLYITSLMVNDIESVMELFPGPQTQKRFVLFPMIK